MPFFYELSHRRTLAPRKGFRIKGKKRGVTKRAR